MDGNVLQQSGNGHRMFLVNDCLSSWMAASALLAAQNRGRATSHLERLVVVMILFMRGFHPVQGHNNFIRNQSVAPLHRLLQLF